MRIDCETYTDAQSRAIERLEELCEEAGVQLKLGTYVGRWPHQVIILDHSHQDSAVRVKTSGDVEAHGVEIDPWAISPGEFREILLDPDAFLRSQEA